MKWSIYLSIYLVYLLIDPIIYLLKFLTADLVFPSMAGSVVSRQGRFISPGGIKRVPVPMERGFLRKESFPYRPSALSSLQHHRWAQGQMSECPFSRSHWKLQGACRKKEYPQFPSLNDEELAQVSLREALESHCAQPVKNTNPFLSSVLV